MGRISHTSLQPGGGAPVAPSPIQAKGKTYVESGFVDVSAPRALRTDEIPGLIEDYVRATKNAREAGFEGVEIHAANGYLLEQFLKDKTNQRDDSYGGTIENRARLTLEVARAVADAWSPARTGIRISPVSPANDIADSDPQALYDHLAEGLGRLGLGFLHVVEGATGGPRDNQAFDYQAIRKAFGGGYVANNGYTPELAAETVAAGWADAIAFGKLFIANPDLVERIRRGAPLNPWDQTTFYGGGVEGYTDYPALDAAKAA